uniref:18S rRNA factor 2 n=1 Tax=Lotharella globosa TaxID=91324 RepID=A0A7S3YVS4_9EUKA
MGDSRFQLKGAIWDLAAGSNDAEEDDLSNDEDRAPEKSSGRTQKGVEEDADEEPDNDDEGEEEEDDDEEEEEEEEDAGDNEDDAEGGERDEEEEEENGARVDGKGDGTTEETGGDGKASSSAKKPLSLKKLSKFKKQHDKTGVVYLSTIPPFMRVHKLRSLLSQYGLVGRIYLSPEDAAITRKRKKYRNNRRIKFTEGWVEFANKKVAKRVALALNNTAVGGKKRDYYSQDRWNMKYLSKFKWHHLTERIAYESNVKHQRVRNDMTEAKREAKFYLEKAGQAKALAAIKKKRKAKGAADLPTSKRQFKQRGLLRKDES